MLSIETANKVIGLLQEGIEDLVCVSEGDFDKDFTEKDRDEAIDYDRSVIDILKMDGPVDVNTLKFIAGVVKEQIEILADQSGPDFDEEYTEDDRDAEWKECQDAYDDINREIERLRIRRERELKAIEEHKATREQVLEALKKFYQAASELSDIWDQTDENTFFDMCEDYPFEMDFGEILSKIGNWNSTQISIRDARKDGSYDLEQ